MNSTRQLFASVLLVRDDVIVSLPGGARQRAPHGPGSMPELPGAVAARIVPSERHLLTVGLTVTKLDHFGNFE